MSTASTTISIDGYTFTITVASPVVAPTPPPVPTTGVQAARVADLMETFGVNTFSSLDANSNVWGSWPADYSPASVIAAMNWLTNGSGLTMRGREYHFASRTAMQTTWLQQVTAAIGSKFSLCVGAGGDASNVPSMLTMAANPANNIFWLEGVNEPNTDFGSGPMPVATMQSVQSLLAPAKGVGVMGPSIVFGLPFPEGYITPAYVSAAQLTTLNASILIPNGHFYPPRNPDVDDGSNRGGSFDDVVVGLQKVYGPKPLMITEWHPTLYNGDGHNGDEKLAAYLTPICLLSAFRLGVAGMWWYSLFDYGWNAATNAPIYPSGLFPKTGATSPRPAAWAIRAMFTLMADHGATKHTFAPGRLDYRVTSLPPPVNAASPHTGGQHALFQTSDGKFCLVLWNSQLVPGGNKAPVSVTFGVPPASVSEFNITTGDASALMPVQTVTHASAMVSQLDASVRVLVITP